MTEYLYKETDNLSTLITAQPQLLLTLSHFGIPMGFGDKTIAQVCAEHSVDPKFFILICEVYSNDNYIPMAATLRATPMKGLVPYLLRSHDYYLNRRLPHIGHHLEKIADMLPPRAGKAIIQFFNAYIDEVREHFDHEENIVYTHISNLISGKKDGFKIKDFLASHGNLEDKLSDLVQIIFKYLPDCRESSQSSPSKIDQWCKPNAECQVGLTNAEVQPIDAERADGGSMTNEKELTSSNLSYSSVASRQLPYLRGAANGSNTNDDDAIDMIFDILQLSHDLRKHAIIEDKILGPYVKQLEKTAAL